MDIEHYFITKGQGAPLILLHGNGEDSNYFQGQIVSMSIIVPPMELQKRFVDFLEQSDKSKFELQKSLAELTAMQKKIIEQNLT